MKKYYVTSLIVKGEFKQNITDKIEAKDRTAALTFIMDKYIPLGYEIVKSRIIEL